MDRQSMNDGGSLSRNTSRLDISRREFLRASMFLTAGTLGWIASGCAPAVSMPAPATVQPAAALPTLAATSAVQVPTILKPPTGEVVWYSTAPQDVLDAVAKVFNSKYPGLTLRGLFQRGAELVPKIEAERAAGKLSASILMVPNPDVLYGWRDKGFLVEHHSPEEAAYPDWFKEPGWWIGARVLDEMIVYNTKLIPGQLSGWEVLADPKYKGQIALVDGASVTTSLLLYKTLKEKFGPDFWPKVVANQPSIFPGTAQVLDRVVNGESAMSENLGYQVLGALAKNPNAPIKPLWPSPTPVTYAANTILQGAPNPDGAKFVYDWIASKGGQQAIVDANQTLSARSDVDRGALGPKLNQLTWTPVDLKKFALDTPAMVAEWKKVFGRQ